jgi:hypothetical protein
VVGSDACPYFMWGIKKKEHINLRKNVGFEKKHP